jgi:nucleoside phosphorylase
MVGPVLCEIGNFSAANGLSWRVVAAELGPGTVDTAGAVVAATTEFRPEVLMFVGIAGALKETVDIGDVVAGTEIAWTERGKWSETGYVARIRTVSLSVPLSQWARKVARDERWQLRLKQKRPDAKAFVQQIASGEKVIADDEYRDWLRKTFSDAFAIENEGFGLARAAEVYADGERYVVRGISDAADGSKSDQGQPYAADAAAAFAFELVDSYSSAQATAVPPAPTVFSESTSAPTGSQTVGDLSALAQDLITDVDLLDDDRGQVEDLARSVAEGNEDSALSDLLSRVGTALGDEIGPLVWRRLFWFGRQLVRSAGARLPEWRLEESVKAAPRGMAVLLTEPTVWSRCPDGARRRCLTALLGPLDSPRPPDPLAIGLLEPLLRTGTVNDREAARVQSSFDLASLDLLIANGVTLDMLVPRILADLDSGEFGRQNTAARFLYNLPPGAANQPVHPNLDFSLGAKLVEAATGTYHSFGADEAIAWPYVSTWSPSRLAGGIWAAVVYPDGQWLRVPASEHLPKLIAASAGKNVLNEVLNLVRNAINSSLERISDGLPGAGDDFIKLAENYTSNDQLMLKAFGEWLRARQAGQEQG